MTRDERLAALLILGVLALAGLGAAVWLLSIGVPAEAAMGIFGISSFCAGAVAGVLVIGRGETEAG